MSNIGTYKNFSKSNTSLEKQEAPIEYNSPNHEEKKKMTASQIVAVILCIMTALAIVGLITALALKFGRNTSSDKESLNTNNEPAVDNKTRPIPYAPERPVEPLHPAPNPFANKTIGFNKIANDEPNIQLFNGLQNIKS